MGQWQDRPDAPGTTGWELIHDVTEDEAVVDKHAPNGFADTELGTLLADTREVVIVGMQSEYCVRETSLAALQQGLSVLLVRGAHATYGDGDRTAAEIASATEAELADSTGPWRRQAISGMLHSGELAPDDR